ncbi:MAG: ImmA/IrrE family metallo-endopeptidase [Rhodospirillaceae bacterium]|nr:ImmA/IrrE family metallo-endopeptidase [Rhodospirillaceae bacterium]
MSNLMFMARPLSRAKITDVADRFRKMFGLEDDPYFPVPEVLEFMLPRASEDYAFSVGEVADMGPDHGRTLLDDFEIRLRKDVYDNMVLGAGRDRFTACHEIGHLVLHQPQYLSRRLEHREMRTFEDPEWQANTFASALMMPERFVKKCHSIEMMVEMFGVSEPAARSRLRNLNIQLRGAK